MVEKILGMGKSLSSIPPSYVHLHFCSVAPYLKTKHSHSFCSFTWEDKTQQWCVSSFGTWLSTPSTLATIFSLQVSRQGSLSALFRLESGILRIFLKNSEVRKPSHFLFSFLISSALQCSCGGYP